MNNSLVPGFPCPFTDIGLALVFAPRWAQITRGPHFWSLVFRDLFNCYTSGSLTQPYTLKQYLASIDIPPLSLRESAIDLFSTEFPVRLNIFPLPRVPRHKGSEAYIACHPSLLGHIEPETGIQGKIQLVRCLSPGTKSGCKFLGSLPRVLMLGRNVI